jgi:hypothetical protein
MMLLAIAGSAHAQEEAAPPAGAQPPPASEADVIWQPAVSQLSGWMSEGITAAAAELDFFDMPIIGRMTWSSYEGVPLAGDRALQFAALTTPELDSYVVGYGAAWEEDTWAAIEENVDKVSNGLAASLQASVSGGPMYFAIAVSGPQYDDMMAAVYYAGQWRSLDVKPWGSAADYTTETVGKAMADPLWAAKYLLTQESSQPEVQPADQVRVYLCTWNRNASTDIDADFRAELPQPDWTNPKRARLTVGNAELLAWVDFDMVP